MFHLYIDTNVFLSLYHFTTDELGELDKLRALLRQGKARLYLPEQTREEFYRNRDNKVADALKRLNEQKISLKFPQFCRDYPEYGALRKLEAEMQRKFASLLTSANEDIRLRQLAADKAIGDLFQLAQGIPTTPEQISAARLRAELGNPPGKGGSIGDAINWEALLKIVPKGEALVFITDDRDYISPLNVDEFLNFLNEEWQRRKLSTINFYKRLASFFRDYFPTSVLATDLEKEFLIKDLRDSGSFATTHSVISKLSTYKDFNKGQRNALLSAALSNNQVYLIAGDEDVRDFLTTLVSGHEDDLDPASLASWEGLMEGEAQTSEIEDPLPF